MHKMRRVTALTLSLLALGLTLGMTLRPALAGASEVILVRTPNGGIQPQAVVDDKSTLHLIYFAGDPSAGDIFYVRKRPGEAGFSAPIRVNSQPGSGIAIGTIRGAQLAVGRNGRVHVSWMGSKTAQPRGPARATPMLYARLNDEKTAFEPQRNVMQFAVGLDGGGSVAADDEGNVYVAWHGRGKVEGEAHRRVWLAQSTDEGKTFSREVAVNGENTGACGCCGMRAYTDRKRNVYLLYRTATQGVHRDMELLVSKDKGRRFEATRLDGWEIGTCPMSTASIAEGYGGAIAAWETAGQVYFAEAGDRAGKAELPIAAPGAGGGRKHPVAVNNRRGETLLVWAEGTGWKKGGAVAWQVFNDQSKPSESHGQASGLPVWSLPSACVDSEGDFTIIY